MKHFTSALLAFLAVPTFSESYKSPEVAILCRPATARVAALEATVAASASAFAAPAIAVALALESKAACFAASASALACSAAA